jgi:hypothetical protein
MAEHRRPLRALPHRPVEKRTLCGRSTTCACRTPPGAEQRGGGDHRARIPDGAAGSELGQEIDLTAKWSEKDWTLQGGVSRFFAGEVPRNAAEFVATPVAGDDSDWAYVYFTLKF